MFAVVKWVMIGLLFLVALVALGFAWLMLGTFTIVGVLLVLAGLGIMVAIKRFGIGLVLILLGIACVAVEYFI
jgi:hypothetical protein